MTPDDAQQIRLALTDDLRWRILTSDEDGRDVVATWLSDQLAQVRADRKVRKAAAAVARARTTPHTRDWHRAGADFAQWEIRSRGFEKLVVRRLRDLGRNEQGHVIGGKTLDALEKARRHAENCARQMQHAVDSLADLASLVEAHINGAATVADLDQALDDLTVCKNQDDLATLRELLAGKRASYAATSEGAVVL